MNACSLGKSGSPAVILLQCAHLFCKNPVIRVVGTKLLENGASVGESACVWTNAELFITGLNFKTC